MTEVDPRWYDGFFEGGWLDYVQPEHDVTLRQVDFLVNERVVQRIATALRPDGRFLLGTIDPVSLARVFRERDWHEFEDGSLLLEWRSYDHLSGRIQRTWTFIGPDGSRSVHEHSLRAYVPAELLIFLRRAGLDVERAWGSFDRTELGDGTRTILLACKP